MIPFLFSLPPYSVLHTECSSIYSGAMVLLLVTISNYILPIIIPFWVLWILFIYI